jgi:hypothetical protein
MRYAVLFALVLAGGGCGSNSTAPGNDLGSCDPAQYPCAPYGFTTGAVMQNLSLTGRRDFNMSGSPLDDPAATIQLGDYYKDKNLKVLLISLATVWCAPCASEQPSLVTLYQNYQSAHKGVAFLEVILQNAQAQPADQPTADAWAMTYKLPFDIASDPQNALMPFYNPSTFPVQLILDTSTMTILYDHTGTSTDLQSVIDGALAP